MAKRKTPTYSESVFINCLFDSAYAELFRAIVFTVIDCGFTPRCALEISNSAQTRLHKILDLIEECKLGIHDISRTENDAVNSLLRFIMPLELVDQTRRLVPGPLGLRTAESDPPREHTSQVT